MQVMETVVKLQDKAIENLTSLQSRVIEGNESVADRVKDRLPKAPKMSVPFASTLPTPAQFIENSFAFAGKLLKANGEFAEKLLDIWALQAPDAKPAAKASTTAAKPAGRSTKSA